MLREISVRQLLEWEAYAQLEPFGETREDYRNAAIVHAIWESTAWANSTKEHPHKPKSIDKYLLNFDDRTGGEFKRTQTWQEQKRMAELWVKAFNRPAK